MLIPEKRSPLEPEHEALGAKMGAFGGWVMPMEYRGTVTEHRAVREAVGAFDLTHLGKVDVTGPGALEWLQTVVSNDVSTVPVGGAQYNLVLTDDGGIVDDLIVYRQGPDAYRVVPNAANTDRVLEVLEKERRRDVDVVYRPDLCTIAVQGPRSPELVEGLFPEAARLEYMQCAEGSFGDAAVMVARSGYTGERGYELFAEDEAASGLWRTLLEKGEALGVEPCGLGARDTLRLEMGYPLHGNDIADDRSPVEARLTWAVALDKGEFRGRDAVRALKEEGVMSRLWGLRMQDRMIPRAHYEVFRGDEQVGETTSGTFSPTLRVGIAMAYLWPANGFSEGDVVEVDVRGRRGRAEVVKPPFVSSTPK
ncbi:MAG: glycine cleavage system aminomethyltransferase GcvT [Actinomycetota bacterium]|nr:glycine cleavage system aminomethyltransferase GcvT [Actinomycetota bacterium]